MRGSTVTACIFHQCVVFCVFLPAGGGRVQVQRLEESEPAGHASAQRAAAARRRQPAPALPQLLARFGCESLTSRINVSRDHVWLLLCLAGDHVSHQERVPEDEVNRLLDVEYLYTCVDKEEDADTKQVYFSLFKLLRKCILQMGKPTLEAQESPPFKRPGIEQPPAVQKASDHRGAGQDVPQPDQLLAAGDAVAGTPEAPQPRPAGQAAAREADAHPHALSQVLVHAGGGSLQPQPPPPPIWKQDFLAGAPGGENPVHTGRK
ncbi:uncharacterized protein LOC144036915 isoform X2 [Vanacampus margaritifer]